MHFAFGHEDNIDDIVADWYGNTLATCSADVIKIWTRNASENNSHSWSCISSWSVPNIGEIKKLAWSHPTFGPILAVAGSDMNVSFWRDVRGPDKDTPSWLLLTTLVDLCGHVNDLSFCPKHFGLRLATACRDGHVRIYEATDAFKMDTWVLIDDFEANVSIASFFAPKGKTFSSWESNSGGENSIHSKLAITSLCWNPSSWESTQQLLVGGEDGSVRIWQHSSQNKCWEHSGEIVQHKGEIRTLSWAPCLGKSFQLVACGGTDSKIQIACFKYNHFDKILNTRLISNLSCATETYRLHWNSVGTVLAATGSDGLVYTWKLDRKSNRWEPTELLT